MPKIYVLRSENLFFSGRGDNTVAEGKPFIARYILSKEYDKNYGVDEMCFLVAKTMVETISIDGDVGGKIKMARIDGKGVHPLPDNAVQEFVNGKKEYEKSKTEQQKNELVKISKE